MSAAFELPEACIRNLRCEFSGKRGGRGGVLASRHYQRLGCDVLEERRKIEAGKREACGAEARRIGLRQRLPSLLDDCRVGGAEPLGKHAPDRHVERTGHAFLRYALRESPQRLLGRLWKRGKSGRGYEPPD